MAHHVHKSNPISVCLLGHGAFADTSFSLIRTHCPIVDSDVAELYVVCNYGHILTQKELTKPRYGVLNIHPSLLPLYRGATPIQSAIAHGDTHTGVTIIKMDEKIDHGPICAQENCSIDPDDTYETLSKKLALISARLIADTIQRVITDSVSQRNQDHTHATYTHKVTQPIFINQSDDEGLLYNTIRAYAHEPGVFITLDNNEKLKIIEAMLVNYKIVPILVQREGKQKMSYQDFIKGYRGNIALFH